MLGAVELGGTKMVAVLAASPVGEFTEARFPTSDNPEFDIARVADFLVSGHQPDTPLDAVGLASFGPTILDPSSPSFGHLLRTPKPGWNDLDLVGTLRDALQSRGVSREVPIGFDTDVNAAAVAESMYGAARGDRNAVYVTVGTGIGGGAVIHGDPVRGLLHPEMGHMRIPRPPSEIEAFGGVCPFHADCWEGIASGPAMAARWRRRPEDLPPDHEAWALEAKYLAMGLHAIVCVLSPDRVVIGGGVGAARGLRTRVQREFSVSMGNYLDHRAITDRVDEYVVAPGLGTRSGVVGALELAARAVRDGRS